MPLFSIFFKQLVKQVLDIIIPAFNPGNFLIGCIESSLEQTYSGNYTITVIDDGSTEDIESLLTPFLNRIRLIQLPKNRGPAFARNMGIQATHGEFIFFQDADDFMSKDRLELTMKAFEKNPSHVMVCGNFQWIIDGKITPPCFTTPPEIYYGTLLVHFPINASTVALRRSILEITGIFDENYPVAEDYDLWMRIAKKFPDQIGFVEEVISFYNWCATSSSLTKRYRHTEEYHKILSDISQKYGAL